MKLNFIFVLQKSYQISYLSQVRFLFNIIGTQVPLIISQNFRVVNICVSSWECLSFKLLLIYILLEEMTVSPVYLDRKFLVILQYQKPVNIYRWKITKDSQRQLLNLSICLLIIMSAVDRNIMMSVLWRVFFLDVACRKVSWEEDIHRRIRAALW